MVVTLHIPTRKLAQCIVKNARQLRQVVVGGGGVRKIG